VYRFYGPLVFANVRFFIERLEHFIAREAHPVQQVIIDARAIPEIDVTAAEQLQSFVKRLRDRGLRLAMAKAQLPLREAAIRLGLQDALSEHNYFPKLSEAVLAYEQRKALQG
jgi:SulP family sulfate permease